MLKKYGNVFITLFILSDILLIFVFWVISYVLTGRLHSGGIVSAQDLWHHIRLFAIFIPLFIYSTHKFDFYAPRRFYDNFSEFNKVFRSLSLAFFLFFSLIFLTDIFEYGYIFFLLSFGLCSGVIFAYHALVNFILKNFRTKGFNLREVLIVGSGDMAKRVAAKFLEHHEFGVHIIGFLSSSIKEGEDAILGRPILGKYDELNSVVSRTSPDIVFFALAPKEERLTRVLVEKINNEPVDIKVALDTNGILLLKNSFSEIDGIPIVSLRESRLVGLQEVGKRIMDITLSLVTLLLTAPLFALVAICIKASSPGPVFYIQERVSLDGKKFNLIKFRTMKCEAEKHTGPVWTTENDPRRTKIGALLRRIGLDELPQFINILKGQMSIVGPRPERPEFLVEFRRLHPHYMLRHAVKAGITGWAQVHGLRGNTSLGERLEYDLYYIENYSLWLDIKIMFMTIPAVFKGRGAY